MAAQHGCAIPKLLVILPLEHVRAGDALRRLPGVEVAVAPQAALITEESIRPLEIRVVGAAEVDRYHRAALEGGPVALWLIDAVLDEASAIRLEDAGVGYVDAGARAWLPGLRLTRQVRDGAETGRSMRPGPLRMAQLLADHPGQPVTASTLARRADSSSVTAKRLLSELEEAGLVERTGGGRSTRRHVRESAALRRWLAQAGRPSRVKRLACYFADPWSIAGTIDGCTLALTGAGAAERLGLPVLTGVERALYRVDTSDSALDGLPAELGGLRTNRGANALLIADPGRLAHTDLRQGPDGRPLAPPSRVMLDLYLETRGEGAVQLFLDLWSSKEDL